MSMDTNAARRHAAADAGRSTFDPVGPCKHGHTSPRWTCGGGCVECKKHRYTYGPLPRRKTQEERAAELEAETAAFVRKLAERQGRVYESIKVYAAARRARKAGAATGCRKAYRAFVRWARNEPSIPCRWCGEDTRPRVRHIDHVIPLARGGADSVENLCVACPDCNMRKGSKLPEEFAA